MQMTRSNPKRAQMPGSQPRHPLTPRDFDRAQEEARRAERAYERKVHQLCGLAGYPGRAQQFIDRGLSLAAIRTALLDSRARESDAHHIETSLIDHRSPGTAGTAIDVTTIYDDRNRFYRAAIEQSRPPAATPHSEESPCTR